jgi:predicted TIM-barrel fold metal-dependent hydrolase
MIFDTHIHIWNEDFDLKQFFSRMKEAGVDGGCVFSIPPTDYMPTKLKPKERLEILHGVTSQSDLLFPVYFINPVEPDALEQVDLAVDSGVVEFKVACNKFDPADERAMRVYEKIAEADKPIVFHTGILFNPAISGEYNRPIRWEPLQQIKNLRYATAHVSWPWTDECIAMYGKNRWLNRHAARNNLEPVAQMYIDLTPGTPPMYRKDVLTKLCSLYEDTLPNHILFGTDCSVNNYKVDYVREMIDRDNKIYAENSMSQEFIDGIYQHNLFGYLGIKP